jgi:hypothetical protein
LKQEQDLAAKIAAQTAKKTAKVESAAAKKIAAAERAAEKKTAAAERKMLKRAAKAEKQAKKLQDKVAKTEKKAAAQVAKAEKQAAKKNEQAAKIAAKREESSEPEEIEGKKKKKKLVLLLPVVAIVVAAGVFFFLKGRGAEEEVELEPIPTPLSYAFSEVSNVPALPVIGEDVVVYSEKIESVLPEETEEPSPVDEEKTPPAEGEEDPEGDAKAEEEPEEPALTATRYRYENVTDPKGLMSAYAGLLTQEAAGFSAVDKTFQRMDLPDFDGKEASEGQEAVPASKSVLLARNSDGDDGLVYSLQLDWDETTCTVVVDTPEGRVHNPPSEDQSGPVSAGLTVDGFRELDPSVLGLPGASMDEYTVYVQDGMLLVYGNTCVRISVYAQNANTGTNEVAGSYFLSADGQHVYRYDVADNSVEELEIPK